MFIQTEPPETQTGNFAPGWIKQKDNSCFSEGLFYPIKILLNFQCHELKNAVSLS